MEKISIRTREGDCLELMKDIKDKSINMILCDLPYGTTNCKWDSIIDLNKLWVQYERIIKDEGVIVLTAQTPFDKVLGCSNLKLLKYEWIWEKTNATGHLNSKKMPMKAHENILVFYKNKSTYNPQKTLGHIRKTSKTGKKYDSECYGNESNKPHYDSTERYPRSIQIFPKDIQKSKLHPTQKPVALFEYLIKTYTNKNDLVLDNAAGSGTTGIACLNTYRNCIMIEKEKKYVEVILQRIRDTYN